MKRVASTEHDLLTAARALFHRASGHDLLRDRQHPDKIGPTAKGLLQDTLARGVVLELVRRGGWRHERWLRGDKPIDGRLWDRHETPELRFSAFSFELCRWLAGGRQPQSEVTEVCDELLLYLALDVLSRTGRVPPFKPFTQSALCRLAFPDVLSLLEPSSSHHLDWTRWTTGTGLVVLEALQADLTEKWVGIERRKTEINDATKMSSLGVAQEAVLTSFLDAIDEANLRQLATFLVEAASRLLEPDPDARFWVLGLDDKKVSLSERTQATNSAAAFLRAVGRLAEWRQQLGAVRFFDEEYDGAQILLSKWDVFGEDEARRAAAIVHELESVRPDGAQQLEVT